MVGGWGFVVRLWPPSQTRLALVFVAWLDGGFFVGG